MERDFSYSDEGRNIIDQYILNLKHINLLYLNNSFEILFVVDLPEQL